MRRTSSVDQELCSVVYMPAACAPGEDLEAPVLKAPAPLCLNAAPGGGDLPTIYEAIYEVVDPPSSTAQSGDAFACAKCSDALETPLMLDAGVLVSKRGARVLSRVGPHVEFFLLAVAVLLCTCAFAR
jgi:hypothetical protein